jgi:Cupin domain
MNGTTSNTRPDTSRYATHLNVLFPPLACVGVPALVTACKDAWYNQTLCQVNNSVVRLGVMQGEYRWHKHDNDDEFFFVLEGEFLIDLRDRTVTLGPREPGDIQLDHSHVGVVRIGKARSRSR